MKKLKVICSATVLALFLSIPVYAQDSNPGEVHEPGRASCVCETPKAVGETGSTLLTPAVDGDFNLSAAVNMLWSVASIF